jgi:hypothetical protein
VVVVAVMTTMLSRLPLELLLPALPMHYQHHKHQQQE